MFFNSACLLMLAAFTSSTNASPVDKFERWIADFNIHVHDNNHREHMFGAWSSNDKFIDEVNAKNLTYKLGHNHLSGLTPDEFSAFLGYSEETDRSFGRSIDKIKHRLDEVRCLKGCVDHYDKSAKMTTIRCVGECLSDDLTLGSDALPDSVDWIKSGAVTDVKNQGQCGSCWSFSTTGALEGAYFVKYGTLPSFSEQQLVDCDIRTNGGKDHGCNGGLMDNAFAWIEKNGGLCAESEYPYTSGTTKAAGTCEKTCEVVKNSEVVSFTDVPAKSDPDMMEAVSNQPVSVAIQADQREFQLYSSGVFTGTCGTQLDHGVLVVGYGSLSGEDFYMVKNSWGTTWGDKGYIRLGRGSEFNKGSGQCGVLMQASYPEL